MYFLTIYTTLLLIFDYAGWIEFLYAFLFVFQVFVQSYKSPSAELWDTPLSAFPICSNKTALMQPWSTSIHTKIKPVPRALCTICVICFFQNVILPQEASNMLARTTATVCIPCSFCGTYDFNSFYLLTLLLCTLQSFTP